MNWLKVILLVIIAFIGGKLIGQGYRDDDSMTMYCGALIGVFGVLRLSMEFGDWKRGRSNGSDPAG